MQGGSLSPVPPSTVQPSCTIWITSRQPQKPLCWKKKQKLTHNSSESKDFCMLPEYRTRGSSLYCLGIYCPLISLSAGSHHSNMGEERWDHTRIFHSADCHSDSRGSTNVLPLRNKNSRLSLTLWGVADHRALYSVSSFSELDSSLFYCLCETTSGMRPSLFTGSLAPCFNSLDCSTVLSNTVSWELAPMVGSKQVLSCFQSIKCVSANLTGDSTCLKSIP